MDHRLGVDIYLYVYFVMPQIALKPRWHICEFKQETMSIAVNLFTRKLRFRCKYLKHNLNFMINFNETIFWSDSMITLSWIQGGSSKWNLFVLNRISKILAVSEARQ